MESSELAESFRSLLLRHRGRTGLSQRDLAARLGAGRRSVQDWEAGLGYPSAERLQALIQVLLDAGGLAGGREAAEAQELWAAVLRESPRMHTPFDDVWLATLLAERRVAREAADVAHEVSAVRLAEAGRVEREHDWGTAPDVLGFVGRAEELATLRDWVLNAGCRLVALLGMGGIGKTILASRLAQDVAPKFQRLYWRSVRDALPIGEWLAGAIGFLSGQQVVAPQGEGAQFRALLQLLHERPSLLILDNFETLLQPGDPEGRYRDGYDGYGRLLRAIGEGRHRSCLLVTSRESPPECAMLRGDSARTFHLGGLGVAEGQVLLADKRLSGNTDEWSSLVDRFGGNGLALKVIGESIRELFGGELRGFLNEASSPTVFGGIRRLLAEQIERSSALEQQVLRILAVEREPLSIAQLLTELGPPIRGGAVLEAVEAVRRRSLVERAESPGPAAFTLQSVVLEYVTDRLVDEVTAEITAGRPALLVHQPLIKAQAKDYVRQTQEHLIGQPILQRVQAGHGLDGAERRLLALLDAWRDRPPAEQRYGPGNVVNLLRLLRPDLRGMDFSHLDLRQAYLQDVDARDASLAGSHLTEVVLAEPFAYPTAVALSADGAFVAAGTPTGELRVWRVADRTPLLTVKGHTAVVRGVALSRDGRRMASASVDGTVMLWEVPGGQLLATLQGHTGAVRGVALSNDAQVVVSGCMDETVRVWYAERGQLRFTLRHQAGGVRGVALSGNGRLAASCGDDGTIRLWSLADVRSGSQTELGMQETARSQLVATLQDHSGGVRGLSLSGDGRLVASGGDDGTVRLWDAASGQPRATLRAHTGGVRAVALSGDGRLVASGGDDGTVRLWDAARGQLLAALQGHAGAVWSVAMSGDGCLVASAGWDGTVRLWDAVGGQLLASLRGHTSVVMSVALSGDGQVVVSGGADRLARLWETDSGQFRTALQGHAGVIWGVALSPDGKMVATASVDGTVKLWAARSGRLLAAPESQTGAVWCVAVSEDGRLVASGGVDGTVRIWDATSGRLIAALQGHTASVWGVAISGDGHVVASCGDDRMVRLWETGSWTALGILESHTAVVRSVALSWDAGLLASCGDDGTVKLWDRRSAERGAARGQLLGTLQGHAAGVWAVALSGDGRLVASSSLDGTARLWGAEGQPLRTLQGHTGAVWGVAISRDGRLVASGGDDGLVKLWDVGTGECLRTLRGDRRYQRLDITGLTGVTEAQRVALLALGAVEQRQVPPGATPGSTRAWHPR